jgi:hypothetical protein
MKVLQQLYNELIAQADRAFDKSNDMSLPESIRWQYAGKSEAKRADAHLLAQTLFLEGIALDTKPTKEEILTEEARRDSCSEDAEIDEIYNAPFAAGFI